MIISDFFDDFSAHCEHLANLRSRSAAAKYIQFPKIPSKISENLAARLLPKIGLCDNLEEVSFGQGADLWIRGKLKIEVKGSGQSEFQTIGPKDWACDALIWLRFGPVEVVNLSSMMRWTKFERLESISPSLRKDRVIHSRLHELCDAGMVSEGEVEIGALLV